MVAVAVGVAVVALGTGVVGCFLQPHQHVHLWREQRGQSARQFAGKPTLASLEILPPGSRLIPGSWLSRKAVDRSTGAGSHASILAYQLCELERLLRSFCYLLAGQTVSMSSSCLRH